MPDARRRFTRIATAGICFQGGVAAVDSATVIAALVHGLTGSAVAVGAAASILRYGWLFPQLFVAYAAQRSDRRMPFYIVGAFGRASCLVAIAGLLALASALPVGLVVVLFFVLWTAYAFISGIVAVPYNDIVGRSIPSDRRSRMLALRFFGGGLLALAVAAAAHGLLQSFTFPAGYAAILLLAALLMFASSISFVAAGEPETPSTGEPARPGFGEFLRQGIAVFRQDRRFGLFVYAQWLGAAVMMALPFYVLQAIAIGGGAGQVAVLMGAQTAGALASNALWGWWGDRRGKRSLYEGVASLRALPPVLTLLLILAAPVDVAAFGFVGVFFILGGLANGATIAMLGYLMEISPDDRRPAYSGYFNALVAPSALMPLAGAAIVELVSLPALFAVSLFAAGAQYLTARRLRGA